MITKKRLYRIVTCILDYCNSLLTGWPNSLTSLQLVPNVPCRPLRGIRMRLHFSYPHFFFFYWLPFKSKRVFKILLLVHRGQAPSYLEKLVLDIKHPLLSSLLFFFLDSPDSQQECPPIWAWSYSRFLPDKGELFLASVVCSGLGFWFSAKQHKTVIIVANSLKIKVDLESVEPISWFAALLVTLLFRL